MSSTSEVDEVDEVDEVNEVDVVDEVDNLQVIYFLAMSLTSESFISERAQVVPLECLPNQMRV